MSNWYVQMAMFQLKDYGYNAVSHNILHYLQLFKGVAECFFILING